MPIGGKFCSTWFYTFEDLDDICHAYLSYELNSGSDFLEI